MDSKPILAALRGSSLNPRPWWLMRQAGRYLPEYRELRASCESFLELCLTPKLAAEATLQPLRSFGMDGAIIFSDILMIPHALGQEVWFSEGPKLAPYNFKALARCSRCERLERLAPVYQAINQVAQALPPSATLIGFAGAPWTLACYMLERSYVRDWPDTRRQALTGSADFVSLLELLTEVTADHLCQQITAGAEVVQLFESWAGSVPASCFYEYVIKPTKQLVALVKTAHPQVPVIGFPRGAGMLCLDYARHTGVDGISLDSQWPLDSWPTADWPLVDQTSESKYLSDWPLDLTLQGNLDPMALVLGGEVLEREVSQILRSAEQRPFIFNLGHGILPQTPPQHVKQLADLINQAGMSSDG